MSEVHYFPRYSQPGNVVTNNTLLLLPRLHEYNRFKFETFVEAICADQDVQLASSWLQFRQQKGTGKSVVDGFIAQDSIKIAVETKLTETFDPVQLEKHLAVFGAEQHKLLILLSPSLGAIPAQQLALVREHAMSRNIQVVHTSFEEIVEKARKCLSVHDEEMVSLVNDYEAFCSDMNLLPKDECTLFVPPCTLTFEENKEFLILLPCNIYSPEHPISRHLQRQVCPSHRADRESRGLQHQLGRQHGNGTPRRSRNTNGGSWRG